MRSNFCTAQVVAAPLSSVTRSGTSSASCTSGMSLRTSCSCSAIVPVESTTFFPLRTAGNDVCERLSDAGARLDDRVHAFENPALDELRHLHLPRRAARYPASARAIGPSRAKTLLERRVHRNGELRLGGDSYSVSSSAAGRRVAVRRGATRRGGIVDHERRARSRRASRRRGACHEISGTVNVMMQVDRRECRCWRGPAPCRACRV